MAIDLDLSKQSQPDKQEIKSHALVALSDNGDGRGCCFHQGGVAA